MTTPPIPPVELPLGGGLDRDSGIMVVPATAQEDLRNVILTNGMALLVKGLESTADFTDPDDDEPLDVILAGEALKVENAGVVVAYRESTRKVYVFRVTRAGTTPSLVGLWFTADASAASPPIVTLAEVSGLLFLAHGESAISLRAPTVYYDAAESALFPLTASWAHGTTINPTGANNAVKFWRLAALTASVTVAYVDPGTPSAALSVTVVGDAITVHLATDAGSVITSTAADIVAAIAASGDASELVGCVVPSTDDGTGVVTAIAATAITSDGIRFATIEEHLGAYLVGGGYGTDAETRYDLVRTSMPGEPTTFRLQHYDSYGQKNDPVVGLASIGRAGLIVYKGEETWRLFGTDRSNFGKEQLDPNVGLAGMRLVVVIDGGAVAWSHLGPRLCTGEIPIDLAIPLALYVSAPSDLAETSDVTLGFACKMPDRNELRFHFGKRYYAFHLVTKQWSYGELAVAPSCGFLLPGSGGGDVQPGFVGTFSVLSDVEAP